MPNLHTVRAFLDQQHLDLGRAVGAFCDRNFDDVPHPHDDEAARNAARALLPVMAEARLFEPIGAQDMRACSVIRESLGGASPLADAVFALQALGATPIVLAGTADQQRRWVSATMDGTAMAAFAMTEPDAGSDVGAMTTTATRDGEEYVLEGTKTFISNAGIADYYTVFASTDRDQAQKGISCFVVPSDAHGLRFVRPQILSAPHPLGEIAFDACRVPVASRLGAEGDGFRLGMSTLDRLRATVAAAACGMATRAFSEARAFAGQRMQFGKPIGEFQLIQDKLARMAMDLDAARLLTYRAAWEVDSGSERVTLESAMAKAFATEAAQRVVDQAVQVLGGRGVLADSVVDHLYRSVRALRIYEGTTEIQHLVIADQIRRREARP